MADKIVVRNLTKAFGPSPDEALELLGQGLDKDAIFERTGNTVGVSEASFSVREGEVFVVMGLSGSGKSTLIRMLNRLIEPTAGEILVGDKDIAKLSGREMIDLRRRDMAMVFQSFALMPHQTVLENAAFGLEVAGVGLQERQEKARQALAMVGLAANAGSRPDELSGGMQQRVGLARALAVDPSIMLMDEAFSALDPLIRSEMQDELLRLQRETARTIVFISHDLDEAMRLGDRIAIMEAGRIVQIGTPEEILSKPADDYVQSFFRGVDVSKVLTAGDVCRRLQLTVFDRMDQGVREAAHRLRKSDRNYGYVIDRQGVFHGVVSVDTLAAAMHKEEPRISDALLADDEPVSADTPLTEVLSMVAVRECPVPVVDAEGHYKGAISKTILLETLSRGEEA